MFRWFLGLLTIALVSQTFADAAPDLSGSSAGPRLQGYFAAYNSGDEAVMRKFILENFADSALARRPIDARLQTYRQMRRDVQVFDRPIVEKSDSDQTVVLVRSSSDEWFRMSFMHEAKTPNKLLSIRMEPTDAPERVGEPPWKEQAALDSVTNLLNVMTRSGAFSGVVLIARDGRTLLRSAYGMANRELRVPNTPDTKFNVGSIGKSFTQAAIQRLISEGTLSLDDTLGKFFPDYPNAGARGKVTVRQLLQHQSGIGDFFGPEFMDTPRDRVRSLKDYLPFFAAKPLQFEPGSQEQYSNGGYIVLGLIIERVTGQSYYNYLKEAVYAPAGMKDTDCFDSDQIVPNRAVGYTRHWNADPNESPELRSNTLMQPAKGSSAGGGYSTADDLLRFSTAVAKGTFGPHEKGQMGIAGGSPGVNAALESGVTGGYTIIVLCNLDPPVAEKTARQVRSYLKRVKA